MMYHYGPGMGPGGWLGMTLILVTLLGLLTVAAVAALRSIDRPRRGRDPERLLADRFARGDLDAEEYERRLHTLRANHS